MKTKILAASSILGAALTAAALIGYSSIEANAGDVPATISDPADELTGPQASCFAGCAQSIWPELSPSGVDELQVWRGGRLDPIDGVQQPREVGSYVIERITTSDEVFSALDVVGGVSDRCPKARDAGAKTVTYCIKRGAALLDTTQIQCVKTCAKAIIPSLKRVERIALLAGPPRTIEITHGVDLTVSEYAACRTADPPTCKRGQAE